MELVICVLEMFNAVSLIAVVQKKELIEVFTVNSERHNLYLICVDSCPFIQFERKVDSCFLFFAFRDQQRAALKFEKMASENIMHIDGFFCKRDGQT